MIRFLTRLTCLFVLSFAGLPAAAQNCSMTVSPVLDFGTLVGLPTPGTLVTATVSVTCQNFFNGTRVCLGINAGTGTGSTVADRRISITSPAADNLGYGLFRNAARTQPFGNTGTDRVEVTFTPAIFATRTLTATIYGRLTAGQTGKSVGNYVSSLTVTAEADNYEFFDPVPSCLNVSGEAATANFDTRLLLNPACTISASPLNFGTVSSLIGHTANTNLAVTCTRNGTYTIALDGGSVAGNVNGRQMRLGGLGGPTVNYQLYRDAARTLIWGNTSGNLFGGTATGATDSVPVYGSVPAQPAKPPGTYQDTVTATITF